MAIGVGLAVAYVAGGFWFQVLISKHAANLAAALSVGGLLLRLVVLAAIVVPLGLYTDLDLLAMLVAFAVVFTVLQVWVVSIQVRRANRQGRAGSGPPESVTRARRAPKGSKGA